MKIGIVSTFSCACGIATYSQHLVQHYPENSTIIFANYLGDLSDTGDKTKHPIIRCWNRKDTHDELFNEIMKNNIDIVHFQHEFGLFQNSSSFQNLIINLKKNNKKIVITPHTIFRNNLHNRIFTNNINYIDKIIAHHPNGANVLDCDKTIIIPHGSMEVSPKPKKEAREFLHIEDDRIVLLCFGFITPNKSVMDAIEAVQMLREKYPKILLIIVGMPVTHGNNYGNMKYCVSLFEKVDSFSGWDNVKIIPRFISEADIDYYAGSADIAIENYKQTEFSTSGMSHLVMSYGLPSTSSNANILADLDETRSLKYEIGDIKKLANNIERLITDNELRYELSRNSITYTNKTSWPIIAQKHMELYKKVYDK